MELNSDVWSKIVEFLTLEIEREAKLKNANVWFEYGRLFKDLRRISKRVRIGAIVHQRKLLTEWFDPHHTESIDTSYHRVYDYCKIMNTDVTYVKYPNGVQCPHRFRTHFTLKKHDDKAFVIVAKYVTNYRSTYEQQEQTTLWAKLFPNIEYPQPVDFYQNYEDSKISNLDRLLSQNPNVIFSTGTPDEFHISVRFRDGKRYGPSTIHFPKKEITYIFIYEDDTLVVSAKKMSERFRLHIHKTSKDSLIQSYVRALKSSLFFSD